MHALDKLFAEKGTGKTRNIGRMSNLGLCALIYWTVQDVPKMREDIAHVKTRLAVIDSHLHVTHRAVTEPGPVTPAASRASTTTLELVTTIAPRSTNRFDYLAK